MWADADPRTAIGWVAGPAEGLRGSPGEGAGTFCFPAFGYHWAEVDHVCHEFRLTTMSNISIEVWDATGNKKQTVELPSDAAVNRVIAVLVEKMNLPRNSPDGQMMSYKFQHRASGRQLLDEQTLASAGVSEGDILRLQPEITAGVDHRERRTSNR